MALEAAYAGTMSADWYQTVGITAGCGEINPFIGRCGGRIPLWIYFPGSIILHVAVAGALQGGYRTAFQAFTVGVEATTVFWNASR